MISAATGHPPDVEWRRRERPLTTGGGNRVPPPPLFLQELGRKLRTREDARGDRERRQPPPYQRIRTRNRAPSKSCRTRQLQVRLPPPPPTFLGNFEDLASFSRRLHYFSTRPRPIDGRRLQNSDCCLDRRWAQVNVALRRPEILMAGEFLDGSHGRSTHREMRTERV